MASGIPALVLLDGQTGELISINGRQIIQTDPTGEGFPWGLQWQLENEMGHITPGQAGLFACCAVLCLVPCSIVTQIVCLPCTLLNFVLGPGKVGPEADKANPHLYREDSDRHVSSYPSGPH